MFRQQRLADVLYLHAFVHLLCHYRIPSVPETKQIPLEETGALFGDEVVVHLTANGHNIIEKRLEMPETHIEHDHLYGEQEKESQGCRGYSICTTAAQ